MKTAPKQKIIYEEINTFSYVEIDGIYKPETWNFAKGNVIKNQNTRTGNINRMCNLYKICPRKGRWARNANPPAGKSVSPPHIWGRRRRRGSYQPDYKNPDIKMTTLLLEYRVDITETLFLNFHNPFYLCMCGSNYVASPIRIYEFFRKITQGPSNHLLKWIFHRVLSWPTVYTPLQYLWNSSGIHPASTVKYTRRL